MNQLIKQDDRTVIPLHRRISEIMDEKGDAFTIRAFSNRLDISREKLRKIVNGERPVLLSELEKVATGLGISVDRIKRNDTKQQERELILLLKEKNNLKRALSIAIEIASKARGITERCISLNDLGRAFYLDQQYDAAHDAWLDALPYAELINDQYNENDLLYLVTANLMITYVLRREFSNCREMLDRVEAVFQERLDCLGLIYFTRAMMAEHLGELQEAKKNAYLSCEFYIMHGDKVQIGKAEITVAHFEYLDRNYSACIELLISAINNLESNLYFRLLAIKEYVKSLIKIGETKVGLKIIEANLPLAANHYDYEAKLHILMSIIKRDPTFAEQVTDNDKVSLRVRFLACKYLINYFKNQHDANSLMTYYEKGDILSPRPYDFLDEEEF